MYVTCTPDIPSHPPTHLYFTPHLCHDQENNSNLHWGVSNNSASSSPDGQQESGLLGNDSSASSSSDGQQERGNGSSASSSSDVQQEQASHDGNDLEKHPSASSSEKSIASITVALK